MFSFAIGSICLALLYHAGIGVEYDGGRVSLFGDNENIIGIRMAISSVIIGLIVIQNQFTLSKFRFIFLAAIPVMLKLMAETGSRVALFSFVLMFVTGTLLFKTKKSWYKIIILAVGAIAFIYIIQYLLQSEILLQRILLTRSESDLAGRDNIWQKLIPLIKENPVFGVGITGYEEFARSKLSQNTSPHNVIIEILCYSGIIGLIFYSFFIFRVTKQALSVLRTKKIIMPLLLLVPVAGIILSGQILNVKIGWLIFAYIIGEGLFSNNMEHSNRIE